MKYKLSLIALLSIFLTGCSTLDMKVGDTKAKTEITGSAGGANSANANNRLPKCEQSLGTLAINENQGDPWFLIFARDTRLTSTVPLIKLMAQQSNCFVVVERGNAGMSNMMTERALNASGELRSTSKMHKGQMVAADYTLIPTITFSENTSQAFGGVGGMLGPIGALVAGGLSRKEASVTLTMVDNRSSVQIAASEGSASKFDFGGLGGLFGGSGGGAFGGYTNTPQKKVITASFLDAYSQLVNSVKNYKQQTVAGGLGAGGQLKVQGSEEFDGSKAPAKSKRRHR